MSRFLLEERGDGCRAFRYDGLGRHRCRHFAGLGFVFLLDRAAQNQTKTKVKDEQDETSNGEGGVRVRVECRGCSGCYLCAFYLLFSLLLLILFRSTYLFLFLFFHLSYLKEKHTSYPDNNHHRATNKASADHKHKTMLIRIKAVRKYTQW